MLMIILAFGMKSRVITLLHHEPNLHTSDISGHKMHLEFCDSQQTLGISRFVQSRHDPKTGQRKATTLSTRQQDTKVDIKTAKK